jgi:hypothetical protein
MYLTEDLIIMINNLQKRVSKLEKIIKENKGE